MVRLNVFLIVCFQYSASNANLTACEPLFTGGSWKKSPVTTTYAAIRKYMRLNSLNMTYLYPSKWHDALAQYTPYTRELVEQCSVHHRHCASKHASVCSIPAFLVTRRRQYKKHTFPSQLPPCPSMLPTILELCPSDSPIRIQNLFSAPPSLVH